MTVLNTSCSRGHSPSSTQVAGRRSSFTSSAVTIAPSDPAGRLVPPGGSPLPGALCSVVAVTGPTPVGTGAGTVAGPRPEVDLLRPVPTRSSAGTPLPASGPPGGGR